MDTEGERGAPDVQSNGNDVHNNNLDLNDVELSGYKEHLHVINLGSVTSNGNKVDSVRTWGSSYESSSRLCPTNHVYHYKERVMSLNVDSQQLNVTVLLWDSLCYSGTVVYAKRGSVEDVFDWRTSNINHTIPLSGLEYLEGIDQVYIEQTVELTDLLAYIESENRYLVKIPQGETLFVAAETSSVLQRQLCGSHRGFQLDIYDQRRQQAFYLNRNLRCNVCLLGCYLQSTESGVATRSMNLSRRSLSEECEKWFSPIRTPSLSLTPPSQLQENEFSQCRHRYATTPSPTPYHSM
uniref:Phospholipid scramblase n=1 Tax=Timema douglasi TaxID=61478 RepID=A0A7R8ZAE8_TIMDO|nr:unnamed protein product [Timema douglasi]